MSPTTRKRPTEVGPYLHFLGADDEIRTRDPHLGKVMLYQLSHVRNAPSNLATVPRT